MLDRLPTRPNKRITSAALRVFAGLTLFVFLAPSGLARNTPAIFSFSELVELYKTDNLSPAHAERLRLLLSTPFVGNSFAAPARISQTDQLGSYLRVASWNIERGLEFDAIAKLFTDPAAFEAMLDTEQFPPGSEKRADLLEEANALRSADVIVLTEVDWGMARTDYRHVVAELAGLMKMNYAFGVQFVELSPVALGLVEPKDRLEKEALDFIRVDPTRYKGLHGTAILSRFPIENVRAEQLEFQPYDWFVAEKKGPGILEKGKREVSKRIFLEKTLREVRRGGRMTLTADIVDTRFPDGRFTVVATHLENRSKPAERRRQLLEILDRIKNFRNAVVLAGDMNTSGQDLKPTSIGRELNKRFGNPKFWIMTGAKYALGIGLWEDIVMGGITFGRSQGDPTVRHIPFVSPNPERKFFFELERYKFEDGGQFDFSGDKLRSIGGKSKKLANSNQRANLGFVTTYRVARPIKFVGKSKLDWIFVKPSQAAEIKNGFSLPFAPHFGRTLRAVNEAVEGRISDHRPLLVDLPIQTVDEDRLKN